MSFNITIVEGRLGKDIESRSTSSGKKVVSFSVASDFGWGDNKGTLWDNVVSFGPQAEFAEKHLRKGSLVRITGERRSRSWDDKQTGEKKYATEITANTIEFAAFSNSESKPAAGRAQTVAPTRTQATPASRGANPEITDEDIDVF